MATPIMVLGDIGTGKSEAVYDLDPKTTFYINTDKKPLSLPNAFNNYKAVYNEENKLDLKESNYYETDSIVKVRALLKAISDNMPHIKVIILDTVTSLMVDGFMDRLKEKGFDKYNDMASEIYQLISMLRTLRDDLSIVVMSHVEHNYDSDGVLKTSYKVPGGKLIGQNIKPEAYFNMVLYTDVTMQSTGPVYSFLTQNNGKNTCRTPRGLFKELKIPNNLQNVINEYNSFMGKTPLEERQVEEKMAA